MPNRFNSTIGKDPSLEKLHLNSAYLQFQDALKILSALSADLTPPTLTLSLSIEAVRRKIPQFHSVRHHDLNSDQEVPGIVT
ncbi:MAG: hypothetical protein JWM11_4282 [Planctomycetaceae bacterium]|nr:hypothetical protein [Planctomycetaceae bacterium]